MSKLFLTLVREPSVHVADGETFTPGKLFNGSQKFCETCEDEDRFIEKTNVAKVPGLTAIPRGTYLLALGWHALGAHEARIYPEVRDVPGFSGILMHGGNRAEDSRGCILLGKIRTVTGIAQCADMVQRMIDFIQSAEDNCDEVYLVVQ